MNPSNAIAAAGWRRGMTGDGSLGMVARPRSHSAGNAGQNGSGPPMVNPADEDDFWTDPGGGPTAIDNRRRPRSAPRGASTTQRNPIRRLGEPPRSEFTRVPNDLIREGIRQLGADAVMVMQLLLSHKDGWETSAVEIGRQFGWGQNRQRAAAAFDRLVGAGRLVIRKHLRDGGGCLRREYVFYSDARRFTDQEIEKWSAPVIVPARGVYENRAGSHV